MFSYWTSVQIEVSSPAPATCDAPATLQDAATASSPLQRFCNAPGHCRSCFWPLASATLLQRPDDISTCPAAHRRHFDLPGCSRILVFEQQFMYNLCFWKTIPALDLNRYECYKT